MHHEPTGSAERVIAYVEGDIWLGHGASQRRLFLKTMLSMGWKVVLVAWEALGSSQDTLDEFPDAASRIHCISIPVKPDGYEVPERWKMIQASIKAAEQQTGWHVDLAFLAWYDNLRPHRKQLKACLGILECPWVGFYFHPSQYRWNTPLGFRKRIRQIQVDVQMLRQPQSRGLGILDEGLGFPLRWILRKKALVVLPEQTEVESSFSAEALELRRLAGGRPIVGLLGRLSPRKGVLNFLRAAQAIDPSKACFLLAGKFRMEDFPPAEREELGRLLRPAENLYLKLDHIEDAAEFNAFFRACDLHILVYEKFFHSSGLLAKAAIFEKPVIVAKGYCMGERVQRYALGTCVPAKNPDMLQTAILQILESHLGDDNRFLAGCAAYRETLTDEPFQEALRQLCGA